MQVKAIVIEIAPQDSYTIVRFDIQDTTGTQSYGQLSVAMTIDDALGYEVGQTSTFDL